VVLTGAIRAQYPVQITIVGAKVGNESAAAKPAFSANDTTNVGFPDTFLYPNGYAITIRNEGGQNNTVTMNISLEDAADYAG
jgi:hypothetical protein